MVAWLVAVAAFGLLHYSVDRWLLESPDGSVRSSLVTTALWAVFFGLAMWWSQRSVGRREG